ncbi:MAG: adenylate/guanylate cyclase domain-containing protein [Flavobacteriales bacterium]|nr:adenylate/guanylate cyclase domain-containing protein [Flavobacteriales bacterium]
MRSQQLTILRHKVARVLTFAILTQALVFMLNWYAGNKFHPVQFTWFLLGLLVGAVEQFFFTGPIARLPIYLQIGLRVVLVWFIGMGLLSLIMIADLEPPAMNELGLVDLKALWKHPVMERVALNAVMVSALVMLFMEMERLVGARMFRRFITGRYAHPRREDRVVMFIDLEGSTRLTEQLGDERYFALLNRCFELMTGPVLASGAEILKYVGDEVIMTWHTPEAVRDERCLHLYFDIREALEREGPAFQRRYGVVPRFHAALHRGEVIAAQVGTIRRSIDLSGDAMNTCARLTGVAKEMGGLVISGDLLQALGTRSPTFRCGELRELDIRGKERSVSACAVDRIAN